MSAVHGISSEKAVLFIITAVTIWNAAVHEMLIRMEEN
jgi:hypothetical protein